MSFLKRSKTKHAERPIIIGITGSIASGKTTVAKWFKNVGEDVISTDSIGHQILNSRQLKNKLTKYFGNEILTDNKIDRKKLSPMVFNDKENLQLLNKLIHPLIRKRTQKMIDRCRKDRIFLEIPLLFENKLQDGFDLILNVSADEEIQFYRLKKNRDLKEKDIKKRLSAQFNANKKKELADINIDNNGTKKELFQKLEALYPTLKKTPKKHITKLIKL